MVYISVVGAVMSIKSSVPSALSSVPSVFMSGRLLWFLGPPLHRFWG